MSEITQYLNLGIAGIALYLMYNLSSKAIDKLVTAVETNTAVLTELKALIHNAKATH